MHHHPVARLGPGPRSRGSWPVRIPENNDMKYTIATHNYDVIARDDEGNVVARKGTNCNPAALAQLICDVERIPGAEIDWDNSPVAKPRTADAACIYMSRDGSPVGVVEDFDADRYANACENPEGHVRAGDVLDDDDIARLGISADDTIYALVA